MSEAVPLAVLESMGSGCTSILSDIPPHREIDPPNNVCYFVEPYDINSIIKIIREVSSIDKKRLKELSAAAKKHVFLNYPLKKMLNNYINLYKVIV